MQQPQERRSDETRGPSIPKAFAGLAVIGVLITVVIALR